MPAPVCATAQFTANNGVLGLDRSAQARLVVENKQSSTGDGPIANNANPGIPGKILIDQRAHWVNDFGLTVQVQVQIQRARRTLYCSAPNYLFIREAYTWLTGSDSSGPITAPTPDIASNWQTEWGGGIDVGINGNPAKPNYGQWRLSTPESALFLPLITLNAGQSIDVRFRANACNPYQWWTNAPTQVTEIYAFSNTIRMVAYPGVI